MSENYFIVYSVNTKAVLTWKGKLIVMNLNQAEWLKNDSENFIISGLLNVEFNSEKMILFDDWVKEGGIKTYKLTAKGLEVAKKILEEKGEPGNETCIIQ